MPEMIAACSPTSRRDQQACCYLSEAAARLLVSFAALEKILYHPRVRGRLSRTYRKRWGHPRRVRWLTAEDMAILADHIWQHGHAFAPLRSVR